jgi:hypothetical protein
MSATWPAVAVRVLMLGMLAASPAAAQRIEILDEGTLPRFEVASVKPGDSRLEAQQIAVSPGRLVQANMPLWNAVSLAFDARMPVATTTAHLKLMLRALLIDRFELRVHVESREQDAFALVIDHVERPSPD